ncbi:MAG: phage portal protein [Clostridia bacterium]|nr:phage portal protein [Clostridia bacterium]
MSEKIKRKIRDFLDIDTHHGLSVNIEQLLSFEADCFVNRIWYRGKANELHELYSSLNDGIGNNHFWASRPTKGMRIRKIHTGLPGLIVQVLTKVCTNDLNDITLKDRQDEWQKIAEENDFKKLVANAVRDVFIYGDGAFKLSYDQEVSKLPIIEFFPGERVEYERNRSRVTGIVFKTPKVIKGKPYVFKEYYRKNGITYKMEDMSGKEYDLSGFEGFESYRSVVNHSSFIPAVSMMFNESTVHEGRGKSIFDGKHDNFDAFDEVVSQWMLAVRKGQIKTYIPEALLPRDKETGEVIAGSDFDNDYFQVENTMGEGDSNKITTTQGEIQYEALLATYCTVLDLCLQGIISPSTLGIDVKKLDNAEAQREKEKTTLYTRDDVIDVLGDTLQKLVKTTLMFCDAISGVEYKEVEVDVSFGGYANPSFEAQVETIGKASQNGIMSIETQVEELYGDSKSKEWKAAEVRRIKEERGIEVVDEPAVNKTPLGFATE